MVEILLMYKILVTLIDLQVRWKCQSLTANNAFSPRSHSTRYISIRSAMSVYNVKYIDQVVIVIWTSSCCKLYNSRQLICILISTWENIIVREMVKALKESRAQSLAQIYYTICV